MPKVLSDELREKARKWVTDINSDFDTANESLRRKWKDYYALYRVFENEQRSPGQSNIFIPKIYEIIEKKVPPVIANEPRFVAIPTKNEYARNVGEIREWLYYHWRKDKMQQKLEPIVKGAMIYGSQCVQATWIQRTEKQETTITDIDPETGEEVTRTEIEEVVVEERPSARILSIFDVKADPRTPNFQEGIGVILVNDGLRWADVKNLDEDRYDLSILEDVDPANFEEGLDPIQEKNEIDQDKGVPMSALKALDKNSIRIEEFYGKFCEGDDPAYEKEYLITYLVAGPGDYKVIGVEENTLGFRPILKLDDRVVPGDLFAIGEVEPLEGLQIEYNNLRNARTDYNNSINYAEWIYNTNAGINPASLVHSPNNIIPVDLPIGVSISSVLQPVLKPTPPMSGYNEESQMNRDFQTISQTVDFTDRGGAAGFTNTAKGVAARDNQVNVQVQNIVRHLEDFISELGMMWLALADKFIDDDEMEIRVKRTEQDSLRDGVSLSEAPWHFKTIKKELISNALDNWEIEVEGGSTAAFGAQEKAQRALNIANTSTQFAGAGVPIDMAAVYKEVLMDSYEVTDPERFVLQQGAGTPSVSPEEMDIKIQPSQAA